MTVLPSLSGWQWVGVGIGGALLVFLFILVAKSLTIAKSDEIITLDKRYFGKSMPDGRTIALRDEIGKQAHILGPGPHLLPPWYKTEKHKFIRIKETEVGIVTARSGKSMEPGQYFATPVECKDFQDGEMFLINAARKARRSIPCKPANIELTLCSSI